MNFIVNLLILLPARIAAYFSWAGPLLMRIVVGYTFISLLGDAYGPLGCCACF